MGLDPIAEVGALGELVVPNLADFEGGRTTHARGQGGYRLYHRIAPADWPGLTPREHSTGGRQRLGRISKRGNRYLRTLLVHCARSGLEALSKRTDRLGGWLLQMLAEKDRRTVILGLSNPLGGDRVGDPV